MLKASRPVQVTGGEGPGIRRKAYANRYAAASPSECKSEAQGYGSRASSHGSAEISPSRGMAGPSAMAFAPRELKPSTIPLSHQLDSIDRLLPRHSSFIHPAESSSAYSTRPIGDWRGSVIVIALVSVAPHISCQKQAGAGGEGRALVWA
jgi:hypothetical protein